MLICSEGVHLTSRLFKRQALSLSMSVAWVLLWAGTGTATASSSGSLALPAPPPVSAPVLDQAHFLSEATTVALDRQLGADNKSSEAQLAVAVVLSTDNLPIADYAERLFNYWGVGHSHSDDGVLIVVDPGAHLVRIQTGSGLSRRLSDVAAQAIINDDMLPGFRDNNPDQAVTLGVTAVERQLGLQSTPLAPAKSSNPPVVDLIGWAIVALVILGLLRIIGRRKRPFYLPNAGSSQQRGWWRTGSWSGGGGGGGGGFGGGDSSGGGGTGSW